MKAAGAARDLASRLCYNYFLKMKYIENYVIYLLAAPPGGMSNMIVCSVA